MGLKSQLAADKLQVTQARNQVQMAYLNMINLLQLDHETPFEIKIPTIEVLPEMPLESVVDIYDMATLLMPELKRAETNKTGPRTAATARTVSGIVRVGGIFHRWRRTQSAGVTDYAWSWIILKSSVES